MTMLHTNDHHVAPVHSCSLSTARVTCLTIGIVLTLLACGGTFWFRTCSHVPSIRPATLVIKYEDYLPHLLGPVDLKQMIEVSSQHCYVVNPPQIGDCIVTEAELDTLYRVVRDNQFDTINNLSFFRSQCVGARTTFITVTIDTTTYVKQQPTGCTGDPRWERVVNATRDLIAAKQQQ